MKHSSHLRTLEKCRKHSPQHFPRVLIWPSWKTITSQRSSCSANFPLAIVREGLQRSDSRTAWRSRSLPATPRTTGSGLTLLLAVCLGPHNPPSCCPVWSGQEKFTREKRQRRKACAASTSTPGISSFPAVTAQSPVPLAAVWPATSAPAVDVNVVKPSFAKPSHDEYTA